MTTASPIPASIATACAAHDRHRLDVLDALLDEAAPSAVRELLGAALDLCATLRADRDTHRDALAAQLDMARTADMERDAAESTNADQLAILRAELIQSRADLASERAHLAACRTRIAGLEQAADERSAEVARLMAQLEEARKAGWETVKAENQRAIDAEAEVARLTARVAELEARPVLTADRIDYALDHSGRRLVDEMGRTAASADIMRHLGPVTLPAQDTAAQIVRVYIAEHAKIAEQVRAGDFSWHPEMCKGLWHIEVGAAIQQAAMSRALAFLGAPPTSPPAARPVFAGVSEEELIRLFYVVGTDGIDHGDQPPPIDSSDRNGIRAVLARLEVSLVAPVDPEEVARQALRPLAVTMRSDEVKRSVENVRATLTAAGIPVTPEVGK